MSRPNALFAGLVSLFVAMGFTCSGAAVADDAVTVKLTLKDHKFSPAEPAVPAGKPIIIEVTNADPTPAEFESKTLRVEKVVVGGGKITLQVRPLTAGRYRFYDEEHENTTEGFLVVN